jgi:hypothetical protein
MKIASITVLDLLVDFVFIQERKDEVSCMRSKDLLILFSSFKRSDHNVYEDEGLYQAR